MTPFRNTAELRRFNFLLAQGMTWDEAYEVIVRER